ncbi:hypothetical protein AMJ86_09835 [bacterium SM23_57]|nr:MAG: hypothetical protein AMJ86_09835 [bacterium SM23_57]
MHRIPLIVSGILLFLVNWIFALDTLVVSTAEELQFLFAKPNDDIVVHLRPGDYHINPTGMLDSSCGNCENPDTIVSITVGLYITGRKIQIMGPIDRSAEIITHAGYGLFLNYCDDCIIRNISITGGERDPDGNATDAAIVVKNSEAVIDNNVIHDNIGDSAVVVKNVVGIMGVCGRENSHISIYNNQILRNSWDGIALYRDAEADIKFNVVDGVDKAGGKRAGGGRGVAIGITWNAKANIEYNLVKRYWKGIGLFVDANGRLRHNIIEDLLTWGIALWDAGKGEPVGYIENNIIYNTGACGVSITRSAPGDFPGRFADNVIVHTAQDERYDDPEYYCYQCALAEHAVPENFVIDNNVFYDNRRATDDLPDYDVSEVDFREAIVAVCEEFLQYKFLSGSDFLREFCRKENRQ